MNRGRGRGGFQYASFQQQIISLQSRSSQSQSQVTAHKRKLEKQQRREQATPLKLFRNDSFSTSFSSPVASPTSRVPSPALTRSNSLQRMPSFGSQSLPIRSNSLPIQSNSDFEDCVDGELELLEQKRSLKRGLSGVNASSTNASPSVSQTLPVLPKNVDLEGSMYDELMLTLPDFPSASVKPSPSSSSNSLSSSSSSASGSLVMPSFSLQSKIPDPNNTSSVSTSVSVVQKREDIHGFLNGSVFTIVIQTSPHVEQVLCSGSVRSSSDEIVNISANYDSLSQLNSNHIFLPYSKVLEWVGCHGMEKPIWHFIQNDVSLGFLDIYNLEQCTQIKLKRKGELLFEQSKKHVVQNDLLRLRHKPLSQSVLTLDVNSLPRFSYVSGFGLSHSLRSTMLHKDVRPTLYETLNNFSGTNAARVTQLASARLNWLLTFYRIKRDKKITTVKRGEWIASTLLTCEVPSLCIWGSDDDVLSFWLLRAFFSHYVEFTSEFRHLQAIIDKTKETTSHSDSTLPDITTPLQKLSFHNIDLNSELPAEPQYKKQTENFIESLVSEDAALSMENVLSVLRWWLDMEAYLLSFRVERQLSRQQCREFLASIVKSDTSLATRNLNRPPASIRHEDIVWRAISSIPQTTHTPAVGMLGRLSYDDWFMLLEQDPVLVGLRVISEVLVSKASSSSSINRNSAVDIRTMDGPDEIIRFLGAPLVYAYADYLQRTPNVRIDHRLIASDGAWSLLASALPLNPPSQKRNASSPVCVKVEDTSCIEEDADSLLLQSMSSPKLLRSTSTSLPSTELFVSRSVSEPTSQTHSVMITKNYGLVDVPTHELVQSWWIPMEFLLSCFESNDENRIQHRTFSKGFALIHDDDVPSILVNYFRSTFNKKVDQILAYPSPLDSFLFHALHALSFTLDESGPPETSNPLKSSANSTHKNTYRPANGKPDILLQLPDIEDIDTILPACLKKLHLGARSGALQYTERVLHMKEMKKLHYTAFDLTTFYSQGYEHKYDASKHWNTIKTNILNISSKDLTNAGCATMQKNNLCPYKATKKTLLSKKSSKYRHSIPDEPDDIQVTIGRECYAHTGVTFTGQPYPIKHPHQYIRIAYEERKRKDSKPHLPLNNKPSSSLKPLPNLSISKRASLSSLPPLTSPMCSRCKRPTPALFMKDGVMIGICCDDFDFDGLLSVTT